MKALVVFVLVSIAALFCVGFTVQNAEVEARHAETTEEYLMPTILEDGTYYYETDDDVSYGHRNR